MTRRRFYVPRNLVGEGRAVLPSSQAHHLRNVLRLKTGDTVEIFDGEGTGYAGAIEFQGADVIVHSLSRIAAPESPASLVLASSLIKPAKFELILQKATELGVTEIVPLTTRLSDIRISPEKIESRLERWERIIREAAKQCRRLDAPGLREPVSFSEFLKLEEFSSYDKLLFYEKAGELWRPRFGICRRVVVCVGPEGGWTADEIEAANAAGFGVFSVGPWILRAETAAIACVSIVQHCLVTASSE
ncbi:MAG: 16S rRNA (uracil(1498)-N(3))-methyltransferase [Acidobacteria bacterium]|nr:16S rRNA (uracil(1498)-N(3))-methyltransferase [Acidobacteriota bacterium]